MTDLQSLEFYFKLESQIALFKIQRIEQLFSAAIFEILREWVRLCLIIRFDIGLVVGQR